jgi:hypothetical protein
MIVILSTECIQSKTNTFYPLKLTPIRNFGTNVSIVSIAAHKIEKIHSTSFRPIVPFDETKVNPRVAHMPFLDKS